MKHLFSIAAATSLKAMSMAGDGQHYNSGSDSSNGPAVQDFYFDTKAIRIARPALIYNNFVDGKTQKRNHGKTFKISKFRPILDDLNVNDQGLDGTGAVIGNTSWLFMNTVYATENDADLARTQWIAANPNEFNVPDVWQAVNGGGNLYGSSRSVGDVSSGMPLLAEGAGRVNRVGFIRENLEATLVRRGIFTEWSDENEMFNDFDVQMENKTAVSTALMEMKDDDVQLGMLNEAGVRIYTHTATQLSEVGTDGDAATKINRSILRKATKVLKINMAKKNTYMVTGSTKYATTPINAAYYGIIGPDTLTDLEDIPEWRPVHAYGYASKLAKDEVGSLDETRFVESLRHLNYAGAGADVSTTNTANVAETDGNADVHTVLYPTEGAYATVGLEGAGKIKFLSKPAGKASKDDPHGLTAIFSGNYFHGGLALQSEKLAVVYHAVSA